MVLPCSSPAPGQLIALFADLVRRRRAGHASGGPPPTLPAIGRRVAWSASVHGAPCARSARAGMAPRRPVGPDSRSGSPVVAHRQPPGLTVRNSRRGAAVVVAPYACRAGFSTARRRAARRESPPGVVCGKSCHGDSAAGVRLMEVTSALNRVSTSASAYPRSGSSGRRGSRSASFRSTTRSGWPRRPTSTW
jgi:hypothetical protein